MKHRVYLPLIITNIIFLFVTVLIFFLFTIDTIVNQAKQRGFADIKQIHAELIETPSDYQEIARRQARFSGARVIIINKESRILGDSRQTNTVATGIYIDADTIKAKAENRASSTVRTPLSPGLTVSVAEKKVLPGGWIIIALSYRIEETQSLILFFGRLFFTLIILTTILILLITNYSKGQIKRPIKTLLKHTSEAAHGGFYKISIDTADGELKQLVENFNTLIDRYNLLIESDNKKYSRINTLLSNLKTGILMVDVNNEVTLINPKAENLLNLNKLSLFQIREKKKINNELLLEILEHTASVSEDKTSHHFSIESPGREILEITVEMMVDKYEPYSPSGVLVILRDVTEMRRLEKLKDEFVANVSHELRTPLTVISGFVETLQAWTLLDNDERATALNIIEVETERLKKLISELLLLSRIEGEMGHARKRSINCVDAAAQVVKTLKHLAKQKEILVKLEIDPETKPLFGITGWFRQIVYNLMDNAIKYTPQKGEITLRLYDLKGILNLEVIDTGCGIPKNEREKIFERFYRKDKSHNSKIAGSGIGLTITKHMVTEFKGTITVKDRPEGGSVFKVALPRDLQEENFNDQT